ncbi:MAG: ABC transporter substrate-binding protein [Corynebacterium sp.]|nr:ABC transporter substrate-binding protein [Corynebacterium sp.]
MQRPRLTLTAIVASLAMVASLSACVTNEELGHPEGWEEVLPNAVPELAAQVPANVANRGTLVAGTNPPYAPFEFRDADHNIIGFEMDLMAAIASVLGLKFSAQAQDFSLILPSLSAGTIDVGASGFTDTEERRAHYDFVNYLYAGIQWGQEIGSNINRDDACGLRISVQRNTVAETDDVRPLNDECIEQGKDPIEVLTYETSDMAATALVLGRVDAFVADSPVLGYAIARAADDIETASPVLDAAPYGFAVPKDSELGPVIAAALQYLIEEGYYAQILEYWGISEGLVDAATINERPLAAT